MAFSTKRVYITGAAKDLAPDGNGVELEPASIGTEDIVKQPVTVAVTCSSSAAVTKVAGFDDLLNTEVVTAIDTHIGTNMGVDTAGNTVSYNFKVTGITRGSADNDMFLNDATAQYRVSGLLSIAIS